MNIIPPFISDDCPSDAEKDVFRIFEIKEEQKEQKEQNNSTVFHSVNLPEHQYKQWAEIDFLLITKKGILVIEVKGGGVSRRNGVWIFTDRFGNKHEKNEGPDEQAKTAMYALKDKLEKNLMIKNFNKIPFGWAVIFPDIDFAAHTLELPNEIVCDINSMNSSGFESFINRSYNFWKKKIRNSKKLQDSEIKSIVHYVRPNFDLVPKLKHSLNQSHTELVRCTKEQYELLDSASENDRILCTGGGGTGKTFLAIELAKRQKDKKILLTCKSPILAEFIKAQITNEMVDVLSMHEVCNIKKPRPTYDMLIVDEGQDIAKLDYLSFLEELLKNGLEKGRWRWFMDFNNQSRVDVSIDFAAENESTDDIVYYDDEAYRLGYEYLKECNAYILRLNHNCRNTEQIIFDTQLHTGADIGKAKIKGKGPPVIYKYVSSSEEEAFELEKALNKWSKEVNNLNDIVILSPVRFDLSCVLKLSQEWQNRIQILSNKNVIKQNPNRIIFSTIREYKGLDKDIVAIIDLEKTLEKKVSEEFLYVSMTRSNAILWMAVGKNVRRYLKKQNEKNAKKIASQR